MERTTLESYRSELLDYKNAIEIALNDANEKLLAMTLVGNLAKPWTDRSLYLLQVLSARINILDSGILKTVFDRRNLPALRSIKFTVRKSADVPTVKSWFDTDTWTIISSEENSVAAERK